MKFLVVFLTIISLFSVSLFSGELDLNITCNQNELIFSNFNGYDFIQINDGVFFNEPGFPAISAKVINLSIPHTSRVLSINIDEQQWQSIGYFQIMPRQKAVPIGEDIEWTDENDSIYSINCYYPTNPVISFGTSSKSGFMIADITYSPLRYNPVTDELQLLTNAGITLSYQQGLEEVIYLSPNQINVFGSDVKTLVENPEAVDFNSPLLNGEISGLIEYAIITPEALVNSFEPLIEWKNQKGIRANVFSKEWVLLNYPGYYDDMESVREFVKVLHANHGLIYLVLAGDYDNLGGRLVLINTDKFTATPPSDQYFSDICPYENNWDGNGNNIYGEFKIDGCDWVSDIYVGRFPVNTEEEATRWVNKVISYEQQPEHGYHERALFAGALLWENYDQELDYCGDIICDSIADNHIPEWWTSTKMYQLPPCYFDPPGFVDSFNTGYNWCFIASHGNKTRTLWGNPLGEGDILSCSQQFLNNMNLGVIHSIACFPGYFDNYECLAEYIFNSVNGGAIAIMMNARYGFGNPPELGPSEWMDLEIAKSVFDDNRWNIGRGFGCGKDEIIDQVNAYKVYHWCFLEYNLFGDPETEIYSREPEELHAYHDTIIYMGEGVLTVNLSSERDPSNGVVCCLSRPDEPEVWFRDTSNAQAVANIYYNITSPGDIILTAYEHDYICYIDTIQVYPRPFWATYKYPYLMNWDLMCEDQGQCDYIMETENNNYLLSYSNGYAGYVVVDNTGQITSSGSYLSPAVLKKVNCIAEIPLQGYLYGGSYLQLFDEHGVIKIINSNYNIIGSEDIGPGEVTKIIPVSDGYYIAVGTLNGNFFMGKFCMKGINYISWRWRSNNLSWGDIEGILYSVIESSDNNYIAVGHRDTGGSCFFSINNEGTILDSVIYGDTLSGGWSGAYDIDEDLYDGDFIIVGKEGNQSGSSDAYIQEVDNSGNLEWREEYSDIELFNSVYISYSSLKIISGGVAVDPYLEEDVGVVVHVDYYNNNNYYLTAPFGNMYTPSLYKTNLSNIYHTSDDGYIAGGTIFNSTAKEMYPVVNKLRYEGQDNYSGGQSTESVVNDEVKYSFVCGMNTFSDETSIIFYLPEKTEVNISIYNIVGQKVNVLIDNTMDRGEYTVNWDGVDERGEYLSSGVYFIRFEAEIYNKTEQLHIIR